MRIHFPWWDRGAREYMGEFFGPKTVFSCRGIDLENGPMDTSEEEAELRKVMMARSDEIYLLCDSSKFHKRLLPHLRL